MIIENNTNFVHNSIKCDINKHINLLHVGWEKCTPNYTYVNYRDIYLVHFVYSGKGILQLNDTKYELSSNDVFLIRPNQLGSYSANQDDPWVYYYFAFSGEGAEEILSKTCFSNGNICSTLESNNLFEFIKEAVYKLNDIENIEFLSLEYLYKFFSCLFSKPTLQNRKIESHKTQYVSDIEEYILFNYSKPISVAQISNIYNLNRSHLHRVFKKHTGRSIENFIVHVRIQEAKRLLRETKLSSSNIAYLVGYKNYPSFFRIFKTLNGVTPTEYRQSHLAD